nr:RsmD family RNA methyltransferase [Paracoccus sp. S-4012]
MGRRGDGVAVAADGSRALAPLTLPGEAISGEASDGRIAQPRIVTPSPERVAAPCPHYRACGGCSLMHGSEGFVAGWKAQVVETALAARGIEAEVEAVRTSPPRSRRRAVLAGRRTKKGALVGFHARASGVIVEVPGCLVLRPAIRDALPLLAEITVAGASRSGELAMTVTEGPAGLDVAVRGGKPADPPLMARLAGIAAEGDLARLDWDGETLTRRAPWLPMGAARVVPPPGGFLQATAEGEAALVAAVLEGSAGAGRVLDLFAGCGTFALPLASRAEVHAVEGLAPALAALDSGWRAAKGLHRVTTEVRDLARRPLLASELGRFDAIVIDPPRAGAEAQAREIAASTVGRAVWIACDPVTFARDLQHLVVAGWRIDQLQVIDQFRWSPHVETAAHLTRR